MLEGRPFAWADVVLAELHRGAWAELERRTRAGLAARRAAVASGRELSAAETTAAARAFRFQRGLLAGEQLDEWLDGWGIGLAEWREYLRRELLRQRSTSAAEVDDDEVVRRDRRRGDLLGRDRGGRRSARRAGGACPAGSGARSACRASGRGHGRGAARDPARAVRGASGADRAARGRGGARRGRARRWETPLAEELAKRRQEWLRLELGVLALDDVDAAREALLCMRLDGLEPTAVAGRARRKLSRLSTTLAEAPEWLAPYVVGVDEGSVIGPVRHDPGFAVVVVEVEARAAPGRSGRSRARRGRDRGARGSTTGRGQDRLA